MPFKSSKILIKNTKHDRRIKLTESDKIEVRKIREETGLSYQKIANQFGVSKRLIIFVCNPKMLEENKRQRAERGGSKFYYKKDRQSKAIKEHRRYKQDLYLKGEIQLNKLNDERELKTQKNGFGGIKN